MNTKDQKRYDMLEGLLPKLMLSEKNKSIAETYLEEEGSMEDAFLDQAEPQDFTKLTDKVWEESRSYVAYCQKTVRKESLERYTRFVAAVGGSTAYYLLAKTYYDYNLPSAYLTPVQKLAIKTEGLVWIDLYSGGNLINLYEIQESDPQILKQAMDICYHEAENAKTLLAALYLNGVSQKKDAGNEQDINETAAYLKESLINSFPAVFSSPGLTESQINDVTNYLKNADPSDPVPAEFQDVFLKNTIARSLLKLLSGCALLGISHGREMQIFLKVAVRVNGMEALNGCHNIAKKEWFVQYAEMFEGFMKDQIKDYILWCARNKQDKILGTLITKYPEETQDVFEQAGEEEAVTLTLQIKKVNPQLADKIRDTIIKKAAIAFVQKFRTGKTEAKQYFLGNAPVSTLSPFIETWEKQYMYDSNRYNLFSAFENFEPDYYRRMLVLNAMCRDFNFFTHFYFNRTNTFEQQVEGFRNLLISFEKEEVSIAEQLSFFDYMYTRGFNYAKDVQLIFYDPLTAALASRKEEMADGLLDGVKTAPSFGRYICIRFMNSFPEEYKEQILASAGDTSKFVKEYLLTAFTEHKEWENDILTMLSSKKSQIREMALEVLKKWGVEKYQEELTTALGKEKSKKLKKNLEKCLGLESETEENQAGGEDLVTELLKGGKKRKVAWAYETPFCPVTFKDGAAVPEDYLQAILICYADMNVPGVQPQAKVLAETLNAEEFGLYISELFDKWLGTGAEAKKKWVLYAASIHGGSIIVPKLLRQIQEWPVNSRGAIAAEAVKALALNSTQEALLNVDQISRKFKFKQVKAAAGDALEYAAKEMGITKQELEDRIVPNLGFGASLKQVFDYGERKFDVYLSASLELEVFDEKEKKLKNLPAPGKRDDPEKSKAAHEQYKQMKKQLKTVVANQKLRLEQALSAERLWTTDKWNQLFVENPVMHQFAIGLIWGNYDENGLIETFRYMEDGSFNTMDEDEYQLPENGSIGLVHPVELDKEVLSAWKEQLEDYEIKQPIEQIDRKIYAIKEEEKDQYELTRFGGMLINDLSLAGKLQGMGWYKGSVQDAGGFYTFYREDGPVGVELEFSGSYVGGLGEEVTIYGVSFYKAGTVARGSYVYDTIKKDNQYRLDEITPRYFSEIVYQLEKASVSSKDRVPYPECKR